MVCHHVLSGRLGFGCQSTSQTDEIILNYTSCLAIITCLLLLVFSR